MNQTTTLAKILAEKKELLRLFLLATVLAFAVGTLGSIFAAQKTIPEWAAVAIAIILILTSFVLLAQDLRSYLSIEEEFKAVVFIDPESNEIIPINGYSFSENLYKTLSAVKAESKSIFREWEDDPLIPAHENQAFLESIDSTDQEKPAYTAIFRVAYETEKMQIPKAARLLEEAVFFVLLESLSTHLSTYFNGYGGDKFIKEYRREDIPYFLLKNRVLNLLSTPIKNRDIFLDNFPKEEKWPQGELYALRGTDGSMYSMFDLILPKGTTVHYSELDSIKIETKRLSICLSAKYSGFGAAVDSAFISQYVGISPPTSIQCRMIAIGLKYQMKPVSLLASSGWEYYRWLDSFRKELKSSYDFEAFQREIHWQIIKPLLFSMRRRSMQTRPPELTEDKKA